METTISNDSNDVNMVVARAEVWVGAWAYPEACTLKPAL